MKITPNYNSTHYTRQSQIAKQNQPSFGAVLSLKVDDYIKNSEAGVEILNLVHDNMSLKKYCTENDVELKIGHEKRWCGSYKGKFLTLDIKCISDPKHDPLHFEEEYYDYGTAYTSAEYMVMGMNRLLKFLPRFNEMTTLATERYNKEQIQIKAEKKANIKDRKNESKYDQAFNKLLSWAPSADDIEPPDPDYDPRRYVIKC